MRLRVARNLVTRRLAPFRDFKVPRAPQERRSGLPRTLAEIVVDFLKAPVGLRSPAEVEAVMVDPNADRLLAVES